MTGCTESDEDTASLESVDLSGDIKHYNYEHIEVRNHNNWKAGRALNYSTVKIGDHHGLHPLKDYPFPTAGDILGMNYPVLNVCLKRSMSSNHMAVGTQYHVTQEFCQSRCCRRPVPLRPFGMRRHPPRLRLPLPGPKGQQMVQGCALARRKNAGWIHCEPDLFSNRS